MEEFSQEIIDNIKHEPEVHFELILPSDPETDEEPEVKEFKIELRKFDKRWKSSPKLFASYFACGKCEYANKYTGNLEKHLRYCKTFKKCENCGLKCNLEKLIDCGFCDQQFKCNNCKSIHISQVHCKDSSWQCSKCDYRSSNKCYLRAHFQIHVKKFSCSTCEKVFSFFYLLKSHQLNNRHGDYATGPEIKFECKSCIYSFATKVGLRQHEKVVHSELKFHCDVCGKTTKTKVTLKQHIQMHHKLSCPICHHLLAKDRLQRHINKHTTTARFKCDACEKVYLDKIELNIHKRRKHEIKYVQCDLCNTLIKKHCLYKHMKIHSSSVKELNDRTKKLRMPELQSSVDKIRGNEKSHEMSSSLTVLRTT